jgi:dihydrofolate reductase
VPTEDLHRFYNQLMRDVSTQLLGRRMYETMAVWETQPSLAETSPVLAEFAAAWQDSDKVVYSSTLRDVLTTRTRIVRAFDDSEIRAVKDAAAGSVLIGGPGLAAQAIRAGLVDELLLTVFPVVVGAGVRALPQDARLTLELIDERRFGNGAVHLAHRVLH